MNLVYTEKLRKEFHCQKFKWLQQSNTNEKFFQPPTYNLVGFLTYTKASFKIIHDKKLCLNLAVKYKHNFDRIEKAHQL
jgi:hypothetical protein